MGVLTGRRRFHPGSLPYAQGSKVHLGSLDSLRYAMLVVWFIRGCWVNLGSPWGSSGSFRVAGFIRVRSGGLRVHSG